MSTVWKLTGVPRIANIPGFALFFATEKGAKAAFEACDSARAGQTDIEVHDDYGSAVAASGADFLLFMLQDLRQALDGSSAEALEQQKGQQRHQGRLATDPELRAATSLVMPGKPFNGLSRGQ